MVFAYSKCIQADLIGMFDLLNQVEQTVRRADPEAAIRVRCSEAIDTDLQITLRSARFYQV